MALGLAERALNRPSAVDHLNAAYNLVTAPRSRVEIASLLGRCLHFQHRSREGVALLQALRAEVSDPDLSLRLEAQIAIFSVNSSDGGRYAKTEINDICRRVASGDDLPPDVAALGAGVAAAHNQPCERLGELAADAVARHVGAGAGLPLWCIPAQWTLIESEHRDAEALSDALIKEARRQGESFLLGSLLGNRAFHRIRGGDLAGAEADARTAVEIHLLCDAREPLAEAVAGVIEVLVLRGHVEAAAQLLAEHGFDSPVDTRLAGPEFIRRARGLLLLSQDRVAEGIAELRAAGESCLKLGVLAPAHLPWRSDLATALGAYCEPEEAVALATDEVELARSFGAPRTLGNALRCLGALTGDVEMLTEAVTVLATTDSRLGLALAEVELGSLRRRRNSRSAARDMLAQGRDHAARCGATSLMDRATAEIGLAGGRPRRTAVTGRESLTGAEERVAVMAGEGRTNKEIAQAMFVSLKTIETQLGAVYRKLQVGSRKDLAQVLATAP